MNRANLVSLAAAAALLGPVTGTATADDRPEICAWKDDPFGYPVPEEACLPIHVCPPCCSSPPRWRRRSAAPRSGSRHCTGSPPRFAVTCYCTVASVLLDLKLTGELDAYRACVTRHARITVGEAADGADGTRVDGDVERTFEAFDRDGTGAGFDTDLLRAITGRVSVPVIASRMSLPGRATNRTRSGWAGNRWPLLVV